MGQPTPPGDFPLYDGLGHEWNDVVGALPEDKRAELAPIIKQRMDSVSEKYKGYEQWDDFQRSGITADQARAGLDLFATVENNPKRAYDMIGQYLNITPQQAQEVVQAVEDGDEDDPRIAAMQQQIETIGKLLLTERQQQTAAKREAAAEAKLDSELKALHSEVGDFDEEEILMRMGYLGLSAKEAYEKYTGKVTELRRTRPAPMLMGQGGAVPRNAIDPTKLDGPATKNLVAQMIQAGSHAKNTP